MDKVDKTVEETHSKDKSLANVAVENGRVPDVLGKYNVFSRLASVLIFIAFGIMIWLGFFTEKVINEDIIFYTFLSVWMVFLGNRAVTVFETLRDILISKLNKFK
jgi:hypothetical protein